MLYCICHLQEIFCFRTLTVDYPVKTPQQLRPLLVGFRKAAGLTQAQLAARLGVTQQTYAQLEAKPESASLDRLYLVLKLLDVNLVLAHVSGTAKVENPVAERAKRVGGAASAKRPAAMKRGAGSNKPAAAKAGIKRTAKRAETPPKGRTTEPLPIASVVKKREKW